MANFSMTCTCGDTMTVDAPDKEGAISQFKAMMDEAGIAAHMSARHPASDPRPTVAQAHAMIEQTIAAA